MSVSLSSEIRAIYRHLLRTTSQAVRHEKAECQNLRRLLREDVRHLLKVGSTVGQIQERAAMTYLLHLNSQRSGTLAMQRSKVKASQKIGRKTNFDVPGGPIHRLLLNVSSLSYHHLSPYTMLQSSTKKTRIGGSEGRSQRRSRQKMINQQVRRSGDDDESSGLKIVTELLPSLTVSPSRPRGPIPGPSLVRFRTAGRWDGQRSDQITLNSSAVALHEKQQEVDEIAMKMLRARELSEMPNASKQAKKDYELLYAKMKQEKGTLKGLVKTNNAVEERNALRLNSARLLSSVVTKVEEDTGAMIGAKRFSRWAEDEWLEPN